MLGVGCQRPKHDGDGEDDSAGIFQEEPSALEHMAQHREEMRALVCRKFHNHVLVLAAE